MANWFDDGIKRITGETVYYTDLTSQPIVQSFYGIESMGTVFRIPMTKAMDIGDRLNEDITLFITQSNTSLLANVTSGIVRSGTSSEYRFQQIGGDTPVCYATRNDAYDLTKYTRTEWATSDVEKNIVLKAIAYNPLTQKEVRQTQCSNHNNGALWCVPSQVGYRDIHEVWQISSPTENTGYGRRAFYKTDGNDLLCTFVKMGDRLRLYPILEAYNDSVDSDTLDIYQAEGIDTGTFGTWLADIPFTVLNNTDYFNPETDKGNPKPPPGDPSWNTDNSRKGGGKGNYYNYPSNDIGFPELPSVSAIDTGFLTMYAPTTAQLQNLVNYLWTSDWIDTVKKMIANPMDAIISLNLIPYDPGVIAASTCKVGAIDTEISMNKVSNQYRILDCGNVSVPEHWGNALDYNNVAISIYLPFVGIRSLDTNLIMDSTIALKYYVDMLTGSAVAMLEVTKANTSKSVYYTFECNLNYQVPITGANYAETMKALIGAAASGVTAGVSAPKNAAAALGATASMVGSAFMAGSGAHHYESSGTLSANTGMMGQYTPYIIVELPIQSLPSDFKKNKGYTSNITAKLGSLTGYTEATYFHLDGVPATDQEKNLIDSALRSGVIL